jgi:protein phosphatase
MDELMPIGEFSERSGLSRRRLRTYAACGLLTPAAVDSASGYRYYAPGQVRQAQLIDALRRAGIALADVRRLLQDPCPERLDAWAGRLERDAADRRDALGLARALLAVEPPMFASAPSPHPQEEIMLTLDAASRSETGPVRDHNEDAVVSDDRLLLVADGMGGHPGGEIASSLTAGLIPAVFTGRSLDELATAVRAANWAIWERATGSDLDGMGTTVCAVGLVGDGRAAIVHVGDSRAYLWNDGSLARLTEDHSVTGDLVRRGELAEADALRHPHYGVLTRALGVGPSVEVDASVHPLSDGDRVLVCSDGLFNELAEEDIAREITTGDVREAADGLVELAVARGGRDNVSVVVAEVSR